jgi:DNA-binding NtrC family response regulator
MLFHELMKGRREEILEACRGELAHAEGLSELGRYVLDYFEDIVALLAPGAEQRDPKSPDEHAKTPLLGVSKEMLRVRAELARLACRSRASLLIIGESGTGRHHCARLLHEATYPAGESFELDHADRLPELAARLGALHGSSGPESVAGLTVHVPDFAAASADVQGHIAKLLAEHRLPLRVIASTAPASPGATSVERRRAEPSCRFAAELRLPPLRERREDIAELADHFAERAAFRSTKRQVRFAASAQERMQEHSWPGNLKELRSFVETLSHQLVGGALEASDLPELGVASPEAYFTLPANGIDLRRLERELLVQAMNMADNDQARAAALLGLTREQIRYRLAKSGLSGDAG